MNYVEIGKKIKKLRKELRMTQQQLANKIYKAESSIRKYEKGNVDIPVSVLISIANALETPFWYLLGLNKQEAVDIAYNHIEKSSFNNIQDEDKISEAIFNELKFEVGKRIENDVVDTFQKNGSITIRNSQELRNHSRLEKIKEDIITINIELDTINYKKYKILKENKSDYLPLEVKNRITQLEKYEYELTAELDLLQYLLKIYDLNLEGRRKAFDNIELLAKIPEFTHNQGK
jgi:transcriptional regulator with XRE-family HTH domain